MRLPGIEHVHLSLRSDIDKREPFAELVDIPDERCVDLAVAAVDLRIAHQHEDALPVNRAVLRRDIPELEFRRDFHTALVTDYRGIHHHIELTGKMIVKRYVFAPGILRADIRLHDLFSA